MKLTVTIDKSVIEEAVRVEAPHMTSQVEAVVQFVQQLGQAPLTVKKGEEVHFLVAKDIYRIYIENSVVQVATNTTTYTTALKLYQIKELLPGDFLQISQSEIINLKRLSHLQLTGNGLVKLVLTNQDVTYSSRRYLKQIKERLHL